MDKISFNLSLLSYLMASLGYFVYLAYRRPIVSTLAGWTVAFGLLCQTVTIGVRSSMTGHGGIFGPLHTYGALEDAEISPHHFVALP